MRAARGIFQNVRAGFRQTMSEMSSSNPRLKSFVNDLNEFSKDVSREVLEGLITNQAEDYIRSADFSQVSTQLYKSEFIPGKLAARELSSGSSQNVSKSYSSMADTVFLPVGFKAEASKSETLQASSEVRLKS